MLFLQFNMQDLQKFIEDWDVIRGKGGAGGLLKKNPQKNKGWKKREPQSAENLLDSDSSLFGVRLPASIFGLSARLHPFSSYQYVHWRTAVSQFRWHPLIISYHLSPDPWGTEMAGARNLPSLQKGRGGHVPTLRIWGRLETTSTWNTYHIRIIGPEEQRLEPQCHKGPE